MQMVGCQPVERWRWQGLIEGGIDGCLLVELPALVLVFIYQARLNAIYTIMFSMGKNPFPYLFQTWQAPACTLPLVRVKNEI